MRPLRYVQTVLWSLTGLGRRGDATEVVESAKPLGLVVVAVIAAALFAGILLLLAVASVAIVGRGFKSDPLAANLLLSELELEDA